MTSDPKASEPSRAVAPGILVDVDDDPAAHKLPPSALLVPMVVTAVIVAITLPVINARGGTPGDWFVGGVTVVGFGVSYVLVIRGRGLRVRRRVQAMVADSADESFDRLASQVLSAKWGQMSLQFVWREFAGAMVACGRFGTTVRTGVPAFRRPIEPITVPFEPTPLNEAEPAFSGLTGATGLDAAQATATAADASVSRFRRNVGLGGGWGALIIFAGFSVFAVARAIQGGRVTAGSVIWVLALTTMLLGIGRSPAWNPLTQWLLVPGGLVVRKSGRFGRVWDMHLFDRRSGFLGVHQAHKQQCMVCVADADSSHRAIVTQSEATLLLRAWLSPLPPPAEERLGDLL